MNRAEGEGDPCSLFKATVALQTVGCKLNQAESQSLARRFVLAGYGLVSPDETPDIFVLNTCTVTHIADRKCRQYLRNFRRNNPASLVVAIGCYADRDAAGLGRIEGVDMVVGNRDKDRLVELVEVRLGYPGSPENGNGYHDLAPLLLRTRAMIKIQDGCNHPCSYCIVPYVRGRERSVVAEAVIGEVNSMVEAGCKEIVLTGTRIGAHNSPGGLEGLLRHILNETNIERIRLSSLQPREISPSLIGLWRDNERICRHLHLALQSGSDSVLRRMNRAYSTEEYHATVDAVRAAMTDVAITTDVIVGFPGESEAEFEQSYRFCEQMGFANLHIFPYSPRSGTAASRMADKVSEKVKKDRSHAMIDLAQQSARRFRRAFLGKTLVVLWEERKEDLWIGHTSNYLKVVTQSEEPLTNRLLLAALRSEHHDTLWGEITWEFTQGEE
ncbi:MAG: tRNA (N(6)-L-threonylcarbamoyladenosine(37)-C(2))-methylthiotransferase MtaB [Dehalococcoidia bacterium]|nr:tRNA (N(6)-L-threonylcarbamoyladenosine(37)-C(2))-methylthiotransferase MtaB [Dehalococcoidia bacterium]